MIHANIMSVNYLSICPIFTTKLLHVLTNLKKGRGEPIWMLFYYLKAGGSSEVPFQWVKFLKSVFLVKFLQFITKKFGIEIL